MKLDAMRKFHPMMKRSDSIATGGLGGFPDNFDILQKQSQTARDRRHTQIKPQSGLDVVMVEDLEETQDPLREIFDADTVLLLKIVK